MKITIEQIKKMSIEELKELFLAGPKHLTYEKKEAFMDRLHKLLYDEVSCGEE